MSTLSNLLVKLGLDKADYDKGLGEAEKTATRFGASAVKGLSAIGGAAVLGGFAAAGAAAVGMGIFLKGSVDEALEAEEGQARLAAVLANTGSTTGVTADLVNELAQSYATMTTFEDDATVAAGAVLARFDTISKETFPDALGLTLDLATALGTDASSAATMLGKALVEPGEGLLRLKTAGVSLTEEQENMINSLMEAGDVAGAQTAIMDALKGSIGGMAEAAGNTAAGKMAILKNQFGEVKETIGTALLPVISELATKMQEWLSSPEVQTGIQNIALGVADFGAKVAEWIPQVIAWFEQAKPILIGIFVALGVAVVVWGYTTASAALVAAGGFTALATAVIAATWPFALIIAAVALLYEAWTNNWFGIRDTLTLVWETYLKPVFETLKAWLQEHIPIAIQKLSDFWNNTLKPALEMVWNFIKTYIIPIFEDVRDWLMDKLVEGIQKSADYWNNTLKPALDTVWAFIQDNVLPVLELLWNAFKDGVEIYVKDLVDAWENKLKPALQIVWAFIQDNVLPIFNDIWAFITDYFAPTVGWLADTVLGGLKLAFDGIVGAIKTVIAWILELIEKLKDLDLPPWLTPGSPTPFEMGLRGIAEAMREVSLTRLPELTTSLRVTGAGGVGAGGRVSNFGGDRFTINNYDAGSAAMTKGWVESRQRSRLNRAMGG